MSFLKELTDKGATTAWSNVAAHPSLIALGTKDSGGGSGFEDHGGELELHKLDFSQEAESAGSGGGGGAGTLLGKVKTSARFATLAWSEMATKQADFSYGLIAGGMGDGTVRVWDPAKLVASHPQPQVTSVQRHSGPVTGLHFNPHKSSSHLLASGGADSEVFIISLDRPDAPNVFAPGPKPNTSRHTAEVTKVAWNSQVSHIMATAAQNGSCIVWDLKQKKPWCELRDPNRAPVTDVAWNPDQGQHLVTASGDDSNPVIKLWDLRSSTTLPLATLSGHSEGVLSVAWCPTDASLLMSCAKDNRTLLWDLFSMKAVYELPPGAGAAIPQENTQMFGGYGKTAQRRYQVSWSPHIPAVVSTCSFDRKVQLFSMNGASTSDGRAPTWHRRPTGASFAFGGRLVSFSSGAGGSGVSAGKNVQGSGSVMISSVKEDAAFVAASRRFEEAMASQSFTGFCKEKENSAANSHERKVWQFMQVIFEKNARNQLLAHLGFDGEAVARQAAEFVASTSSSLPADAASRQQNGFSGPKPTLSPGGNGSVLDDDSTDIGPPGEAELAEAMDAVDLGSTAKEEKKSGGLFSAPSTPYGGAGGGSAGGMNGGMSSGQPLSKAAEAVIKRSLLVGNFEAAVQCCMSTGNMADAMLLASCGGADLWAKTQAQYFARESHQRPFLRVVNAIIKSELGGLVDASDLGQWQETLAILSTYAKQEEFPELCGALAARLETEVGDRKSANLCYMCAVKVPKTVNMWAEELRAANAAASGGTDTKALQEFVEKVSVFTQEPNDPPGEEVAAIFAEYAGILASEGETDTALKYIRGQDGNGAILLDRLYNAASHPAGTRAPPFPFERARVGVSPQSVLAGGGGGAGGGQGGMAANGASQAASGMGSVNPSAAGAGGAPPLPPGWTRVIDARRGIPYYWCEATGESQWEPPSPPPQQPQRQQPAVAPPAPVARVTPSPHMASAVQSQQRPYGNRNPAVTQPGPAVHMQPAQSAVTTQPYGGGNPAGVGAGTGAARYGANNPAAIQSSPSPTKAAGYGGVPGVGGGVSAPYGGVSGGGMNGGAGAPGGVHTSPYGAGMTGGGAPGGVQGGAPGGYTAGGGMRGGPQDQGGMGSAVPGVVAMTAPGGPRGVREGGGANSYGMSQAGPQAGSAQVPAPAPAPVATTAAPPPPSDAESQAVVSAMNGMLAALSELPLSAPERKMLADVTRAAGVLFAKMGHGQVERETLTKVSQLVDSLQARDMKAANAIQQGLANSAWQNHKDWLKGLKYITTLVSRRL